MILTLLHAANPIRQGATLARPTPRYRESRCSGKSNRSSRFVQHFPPWPIFIRGNMTRAWRKLRFFGAPFGHPDFYLRSAVNRGKKTFATDYIGIILMALKICQLDSKVPSRKFYFGVSDPIFWRIFFTFLHFAISFEIIYFNRWKVEQTYE